MWYDYGGDVYKRQEHLSFKAFNEGIRLKDCIRMQQKLMNVDVYKRQDWLIRPFYELTVVLFRCCERINQRNPQNIAA